MAPGLHDGIRVHNSNSRVQEGDTLVLPSVSLELVQYLNRMFPDRLSLVTQLGSVEAASGARAVVDHLIQLHQEQQSDDHVLRRQVFPSSAPAGPGASAPAPDGRPGEPGVQ